MAAATQRVAKPLIPGADWWLRGAFSGEDTDNEQQVTDLHYYEGLSRQEIAERLGISRQRVAQILQEAQNKLREELDAEADKASQEEDRSRPTTPAGLSEKHMRVIRDAEKHLPSERDMRTIRDAAKHFEQWKKYLG